MYKAQHYKKTAKQHIQNVDLLLENNNREINGYELDTYEQGFYNMLIANNVPARVAVQQARDMAKQANNPNLRFQNTPTVAVADSYNLDGFALLGTAANFTISIKRLTNNIATPLPVPLFGAIHFQSAYAQIIDMTISPGTTITNFSTGINDTTLPNNTICEIEYTNGADVDKVQISCNTVPYPTFIAAMQGNDVFKLSKLRLTASVSAQADLQFSQTFKNRVVTLFGGDKGTDLPVSAAKSPFQQQTAIVDVDGEFFYNKQKMLQVNIIEASAPNFTLSIAAFVSHYSKDQV